ncbi:tRNA glutamyl-Q(34) synthetase GluQRS [Hyphococcus flavus]|uniref:tRNA glutamyl-Q(34) synthetase GluQRS n=1 Tax=Hyphococcus flavus TaxID=1866326 RepID=A0AAE9ZDN3_9PROT|nr:tRNA glutamyl-Q(34) synthetase GluQRS [Hyphococcus flavus]WDI33084.1 tRNA glutamyl-Q(34) synthetase GluQRS [Hyphococcus flavus]
MNEFITRFAPSPTGLLHLGHAYSALVAYQAALEAGGRFILRIEDIDLTRCKPEFEKAIYDDLEWLGLDWEQPVRRQSDHFADYARLLDQLIEKNLVYRCFKTRKEVADEIARAPHLSPDGPEGPAYIGAPLPADEEKKLIDEGAPYAWRLSMNAARTNLGAQFEKLSFIEDHFGIREQVKATPEIFGDAVIARKDNGTSYHLASVHDDALQGVSHVIRGEDLYYAAHLHRLLQELLNLPAPLYRHHKLITDGQGKRLAKRDKAATLQALRQSGVKPGDIRQRLGV